MKRKQISQFWNFIQIVLGVILVSLLFALVANWSKKRERPEQSAIELQSYHNGLYENVGENEILIVKQISR